MRALAVLLLASAAFAEPVRLPEVVDLKNKKDPVSGKKVAVGQVLDWHGVRVHFESMENAATFKAKPEKYLETLKVKLLKHDGKTVVSLENKTCPVSGKKADRKQTLDRKGIRLYLADKKHAAEFAKDPAKYHAKLGFGYVPSVVDLQNKSCPVTGDECYPEAPIWIDVQGVRIRVCCDHCVKEVKNDPKRVFLRLMIDPEKLKAKYR